MHRSSWNIKVSTLAAAENKSLISIWGCVCTDSVNLLNVRTASAQHLCNGDCVQQMRRVNNAMPLEKNYYFSEGLLVGRHAVFGF